MGALPNQGWQAERARFTIQLRVGCRNTSRNSGYIKIRTRTASREFAAAPGSAWTVEGRSMKQSVALSVGVWAAAVFAAGFAGAQGYPARAVAVIKSAIIQAE